jgi:transcription antitermination factor NusA-like protein
MKEMKTQLCNFCLKSGILCSKCQTKVKSGEVTDAYLRMARLLSSLESQFNQLQDVYLHGAVEADGLMALIVGRGDVTRIFSQGGKLIRAIGEKAGKSVRILERGVDERKFLEDLFAPLPVVTINTIWLPDGTTETRVILKKRGRRPPPINVEALKQIAKRVRNMTLRVEFTR